MTETVADHIAYLRSRTYDQRAQRAAECMERMRETLAELRKMAEAVSRRPEDGVMLYLAPDDLRDIREALGESP